MEQLKILKDNELIDNKLYYHLKPTDSPAPRFYGQPKLHKPGVPIIPIVSYSGSSLYNLNKSIANILKAYVKDENNNAKNSTTFSNYIRNVPIEDDKIMVSFDVTSLYMNISIIDTLNIIPVKVVMCFPAVFSNFIFITIAIPDRSSVFI